MSAAALPAYSPPERFWKGLAERRAEHGFLICFDEVVTGIGRVGSWLAAHQLPIEPDIVTVGKGLGAGYAPLGAVVCRQHVYDAIDQGSREFDLGHTWDGAPLPMAVGLAVLDAGRARPGRAGPRPGPGLRDELAAALEGSEIVREVRGRGFLLGVELVDPRDGTSFLPVELDAAALVDDTAFEHGLLVTSTHPQADGFAGDQTLLAPAYVEHGRGARRDGRSLRGDDRGRRARDQGQPVGLAGRPGASMSEEFVLLGIPDMNGSIRGKALRPDAFESALRHGTVMTDLILGLDPVDTPIADYERFGIRTGAADLIVHPDPDTIRDLSWRPGWRVCLATPSWPDGSPCDFASREVFRTAVEDVADLGYEVMSAIEYEIRLWDPEGNPLSSGISYSVVEIGRYERFLDELVPALEGLGVRLSAVHTEAGPGLLELNLEPRRGLAAADDAALVKFGVKQVAASMGLRASFLAKTVPGEEGSSGHVHLSRWRARRTRSPLPARRTRLPRCSLRRSPACSSTCRPPRCC